MTIHKTQGATVGVALVLVDETMTREQLYTALSRGRVHNIIYVSAGDLRAELAHVAEAGREPLQALIGIIARTGAKEMAIEGSQLTL